MRVDFPAGFLWGSSISSYQTEGDALDTDWYLWEKEQHLACAGSATRHYQQYRDDFYIAHSLSHNAFRFSLEWSKISPSKNFRLTDALKHYVHVCEDLIAKNITPIVCLHHFTNPLWFTKEGGWLNTRNIDYFIEYVRAAVSVLKKYVRYWIVFNEPFVFVYNGYVRGIWPPGIRSNISSFRALSNIAQAYSLAYQEIKYLYGKDESFVSITKHMRMFVACSRYNLGQNTLFAFLRSRIFNYKLIETFLSRGHLDFLGLNYYCKEFVRVSGLFGRECTASHHKDKRNALGWYIDPQGLLKLLKSLKCYDVPIIITENGTSAQNDQEYFDFLYSHLKSVAYALKEGVDVRGYLWWSLLDNFEWDKGYQHRFGLVKVDFKSFTRTIKPFALRYKEIIEDNAVSL